MFFFQNLRIFRVSTDAIANNWKCLQKCFLNSSGFNRCNTNSRFASCLHIFAAQLPPLVRTRVYDNLQVIGEGDGLGKTSYDLATLHVVFGSLTDSDTIEREQDPDPEQQPELKPSEAAIGAQVYTTSLEKINQFRKKIFFFDRFSNQNIKKLNF